MVEITKYTFKKQTANRNVYAGTSYIRFTNMQNNAILCSKSIKNI